MQQSMEMRGTTDSVFTVLAATQQGAVGFREIDDGMYRVRVVPSDPEQVEVIRSVLSASDGWKQPEMNVGCLFRFSLVVSNRQQLLEALSLGLVAIGNWDSQVKRVFTNSKLGNELRKLVKTPVVAEDEVRSTETC